jgi:hypothetical protein
VEIIEADLQSLEIEKIMGYAGAEEEINDLIKERLDLKSLIQQGNSSIEEFSGFITEAEREV